MALTCSTSPGASSTSRSSSICTPKSSPSGTGCTPSGPWYRAEPSLTASR